jgi:predicted transcriptional regulator
MQDPIATRAGDTLGGVVTMNYAIPEDLHHRLKVMAAQQGTTLKAVVIQALEEYAERQEPKKAK